MSSFEIMISIHAPAWGATSALEERVSTLEFQSTLPHGERQYGTSVSSLVSLFQSTLPHGERPTATGLSRVRLNFNPRSRMGSDQFGVLSVLDGIEFQSTLPHGERPPSLDSKPSTRLFQSTLPHGERRTIYWTYLLCLWYFNPRSRMGSDSHASTAA